MHTLVILTLVLILLALLFPNVTGLKDRSPKTYARAASTLLVAALKNYYTEYGRWPDFTGDGQFLDAPRNARLLQVLTARDETNNPRKITFFEAHTATKHRMWSDRVSNGLDPTTGTLIDPWGNPYRIILDTTHRGVIPNPYPQDPDPNIQSPVIVWSLGEDGQQGAPKNDQTSRGSDDICSWR